MAYKPEDKEKIFDEICQNVIENKVSFNQAIGDAGIKNMTFYRWLIDNKDFQERYNYAREIRSDILFEEIIEIADTTEEGTKTKDTPKGLIIETGDMTDHRRLKIDARKWVVAKMNPRKYGDKSEDKDKETGDNEIIIKRV